MSAKGRDSAFLKFFWDLAVEDTQTRVDACGGLVDYMQKAVKQTGSSDKEAQEETQGLVDYALKRLVRGLGSSRECARQGFSVALCEVLTQVPQYTDTSKVLAILDENTKVSQ
jgi:DNA polymerase phi